MHKKLWYRLQNALRYAVEHPKKSYDTKTLQQILVLMNLMENPKPKGGEEKMLRFRRIRARRMYEVLTTLRPFEQGNHRIELRDGRFIFYYRGTPIMAYHMHTGERIKLDAGEFETTNSTRAQRKAIHEALDEFEEVMKQSQVV